MRGRVQDNTKRPLKNLMETCYCRSFLKYIRLWKEFKQSHHITGETVSQLDILSHQVKLPVPERGYIQLNCWPKGSHRPPPHKHRRLFPRLLVTLHNLNDKALLLKTQLICVTEQEIELVPSQKPYPSLLASIHGSGRFYALKRKKTISFTHVQSLQSTADICLPNNTAVAQMLRK